MLDLKNTSRSLGRPPDYRCKCALAAAAAGRLLLPASHGADACELALQFARALGDCGSPPPGWVASKRSKRVAAAWALASDKNRTTTVRLEALTLAAVAEIDIAERLQMELGLVQTYEDLFFEVRQRLHDWAFIHAAAIEPELSMGTVQNRKRRAAMKLVAYHCGADAFDDIYGGPCDAQHKWVEPSRFLKQQSLQRHLDSLAEASTLKSAGRVSQCLAEALTHLGEVCSRRYPQSEVERDVAEISQLLGGQDIPNMESVLPR
jgi:hypothetical protein